MRAIFFGSPDFAVPCLDALHEIAEVVLVVSQPDRPSGRGMKLRPPPVKARALELGLPVEQPKKLRSGSFPELVRELQADVGVVVAYGRILPLGLLEAPRHGCVNVHASLLPRWRGASPIHHAVVAGDERTGVKLMRMDEGLDTGPMLATVETPIGPDETTGELWDRLAALGGALIREELPRYVAGELIPRAQPDEGVTLAPMMEKEDGRIDWERSAKVVHDQVRGFVPWPGAFTELAGVRVKVLRARVLRAKGRYGAPGSVLTTIPADPSGAGGGGAESLKGRLAVACAEGALELLEVQEAGRKALAGGAFRAGQRGLEGAVFGEPPTTHPAEDAGEAT